MMEQKRNALTSKHVVLCLLSFDFLVNLLPYGHESLSHFDIFCLLNVLCTFHCVSVAFCPGAFCLETFRLGIFRLGIFCPWNILSMGHFIRGPFFPLNNFPWTFSQWDILSLDILFREHFILGHSIKGKFWCSSIIVIRKFQ